MVIIGNSYDLLLRQNIMKPPRQLIHDANESYELCECSIRKLTAFRAVYRAERSWQLLLWKLKQTMTPVEMNVMASNY